MIKILADTTCTDEHVSECAYVLLELDDARQVQILAWRAIFVRMKATTPELDEMVFSGIPGEFYDLGAWSRELSSSEQAAYESCHHVVVDPDFMVLDDPSRTECDKLVVDELGFYVRAYPKHLDAIVESPHLPYALLEGSGS